MRQLLMDEISRPKMKAVETYLPQRAVPSGMEKIFWLELPDDLLSPLQMEHKGCGPHYLAVETGKDFVKFEFLVRCRNRFRCDCIGFATPDQERFLLDFAREMVRELEITT
ncbi:MAG: hypothetical protein AB1585_05300 [Thermodesulfobacteriota bacterium]